ncbi:MAG TPA: 3'-5' exonuclease, partial [Armatimonadota bacterium]|nr:3'-5' exonuclease [Armatimonadota bacterium]
IRRWLEYSYLRPDELVLQLAGELELDREQTEIVNTFTEQISRFLRDYPGSDLLTVMQETKGLDKTMKLVIRNIRDRRGYTPRPGVVSLSTMHRAKGLEWDIVYVTGITVEQFPEDLDQKSPGEVWSVAKPYRNPAALAKAQLDFFADGVKIGPQRVAESAKYSEISENLRLIYVAVTRARERLVLSSHNQYYSKSLVPSSIFTEMKRFVGEKYAQQPR